MLEADCIYIHGHDSVLRTLSIEIRGLLVKLGIQISDTSKKSISGLRIRDQLLIALWLNLLESWWCLRRTLVLQRKA